MRDKLAGGTGALVKVDNCQTLCDQSAGLFARSAMNGATAFTRYHKELWAARAVCSEDDVFIAIVDSGGERIRTMTASPGDSIIVGRHTKCDLQLSHKNVALRQLALHVARKSSANAPRIRLWDLHTGKTLVAEDGKKIEALESNGPVLLRLGRYHFAVIPLGQIPKTMPASLKEAWASLPERTFVTALGQGSRQTLLPERFGGPSGTSSITLLPSSIGLGEVERTPVAPHARIATLYLQSEEMRLTFHVGHEHLERGILIGRYGRCLSAGFDRSVSRVHLLLAAVDGEIVAIDSASTVGSRISSLRIKSLHLNSDTKIALSKRSYLRWTPRESSN